MKVGLFFGSFNPIHVGHLIIANHFLEFTEIEKVWFIVSPQNPLKKEKSLLNQDLRLKMVKACLVANKKLSACDVEYHLPKPSYTINTLKHLKSKYPWYSFIIIMGADSFDNIRKWKDYKSILSMCPVYIYNRLGFSTLNIPKQANVSFFDFPFLDISATYIRDLMRRKKSVQFMVPDQALKVLLKK